MKELTIQDLEKTFYEASKTEAKFVGVLIKMEGFPEPEVIINSAENFDSKFAYYKSAYDENLNHKHAKGIKIIGFTYRNTLEEIEKDLIYW